MTHSNNYDIIIIESEREVNKMDKVLVFDMDGTIANFYGVDGWLNDLRAEKTRPYRVAEPLYDTDLLNSILAILKDKGWKIVVTTWLSMGASREFDNRVRSAKKHWLDKYDFPYDELHMVKYGTPKHKVTRYDFQVLVDDNAEVRNAWDNRTIDANKNIINELMKIICDEF